MICPNCGKEMEKGYIESARGIYFTKEQHHIMMKAKGNDISLDSTHFFDGSRHPAYHCPKCQMITVSYYKRKEK